MAQQEVTTGPLLEAENLTKEFGSIVAVDGINLSLSENEFTAIIGPNGAGKTTLLRILTGEMTPTRGTVRFAGKDITGLDQAEVCRLGLGKSFQRSALFEDLTVLENVRLAVQQARNSRLSVIRDADDFTDDIDRAREVLSDLGLESEATSTAGSLSHGEKRKLDIAITLATNAEMIMLDEPMSGVSESSIDDIVELLNYIARDHSLVTVEHNISFVMENADRIIVLEQGAIIADGSTKEIRQDQRVQEAYLGDQ